MCVCIQEFCWTSDSTMDEDRGGGVFTAAELSLEILDHLERLWSL